MKTLLTLATFLLSTAGARAAQDNAFYCHGIEGDEGKTMYARLLGASDIREGDRMEFLFVLRDGSQTLFSGHVRAEEEDVMLSFRSRSPKLSAMIYLDEYDQTWVKLGNGKDLRFDCTPREDR